MPNIRGRFNRAIAAILAVNDQIQGEEAKDKMRQTVLSEINDLRRWAEEVLSESDGDTSNQPTHFSG